MCGFVGVIDASGELDITEAATILNRRGPDASGKWNSLDYKVRLLHTRLAIVDEDPRANQPLITPDQSMAMVLVGEIYNYKELRDSLAEYSFQTSSDTEVALALYVQHGIEGLSQLKGMFVIAIVDENIKKVFLVRDPIGKKPLYVANWNNQVLFGTNSLSFPAITKSHEGLDEQALSDYWQHSFINPQLSVFKNVYQVNPGQTVELDWQGKLLRQSSFCAKPDMLYDGEALSESIYNVKELLTRALESRLRNNPHPVFLLSGGLDSTLLSIYSQDLNFENQTDFKYLSLKSWLPYTADEPYARFAAHKLKIKLNIVSMNVRNMGDEVLRCLDLQDEPLGMISFFMLKKLIEAASPHGKVLITGDGGDEVFLGYGKADNWIRKDGEVWQEHMACGPGLPKWMSSWGCDAATDSLIGHHFTKIDRASAEQGNEIRCPFLDYDLMSYVRSLPQNYLLGNGECKYLLKEQFTGWPRWFTYRKKIGFAYNLRWAWSMNQYHGLRELIEQQAVDTFRAFLPIELHRSAKEWKTRHIFQNFTTVWKLLSWSVFLRKLKVLVTT